MEKGESRATSQRRAIDKEGKKRLMRSAGRERCNEIISYKMFFDVAASFS